MTLAVAARAADARDLAEQLHGPSGKLSSRKSLMHSGPVFGGSLRAVRASDSADPCVHANGFARFCFDE